MTNPPQDFRSAGGGYPPPGPPSGPPAGPPQGPPQGPPSGPPPGEQYAAPPPQFGGPPAGEPGQTPQTSGPYPVEPEQPQGESTGETPKLPPAGFDDRGKVRRGTISAVWVGIVAAAVVLILLIIFIAQNLERVTIHFLGFSGSLPIGLVALISAVVGVLIAAVPGTVRILQLRKALKTNTPKDQRLP